MQIQQGDLVIERIEAIPSGAEEKKSRGKKVLVEGEGHHVHRAAATSGVSIYMKGGIQYARFAKETVIEHVTPDGQKGEHEPVLVPAGDYQFGQVFEYDYLAEMAREVID